jgi:ribosomal protein L16 Arg81 hydroxylase
MFGYGNNNNSLAQKQEAERLATERAMQDCKDQLRKMREAEPDEAERLSKMLKDRCAQDKRLPYDFKRKLLERARVYECNANMRAADKALHAALRLAAEEQMVQRAQKLGEGRRYFSKACALGADADYRAAAQRLMENIMLTGGIQHKGPTRAKPADIAPRAPNRAKA